MGGVLGRAGRAFAGLRAPDLLRDASSAIAASLPPRGVGAMVGGVG